MTEETPEPKSGFKTVLVFSMLFAVLGAVVVFAYFATFRRPITTVILVRHAEKMIDPNNTDPDLSPAGQARAQDSGQVVFVAGHNNSVPEIIAALGGPTFPTIPETEYDNLYIVTVYRTGKARVLKLKYGSPVQDAGAGKMQ